LIIESIIAVYHSETLQHIAWK